MYLMVPKMRPTRLFHLVIITAIVIHTDCADEEEPKCTASVGKSQKSHLSMRLKRSGDGEWNTKFSVERNGSPTSDIVDLDLTHVIAECSNQRKIKIEGEIAGNSTAPVRERLLFHKVCSPNAIISNGGRTLLKKSSNVPATAFTDRPLEDDELFSVRFDRKNPGYSVMIGVTNHLPGSKEIPDHFYFFKTGAWLFIHKDLYIDGELSNSNYVKEHLNSAKVGDVFGVMRSKNGSLHLFVNGEDQGPAAPIPKNVYGVFELYNDGLEGTIVDEMK